MTESTHVNSADWMADLDARYRAASGLDGRRFYSIFYSQVGPADVLILGLNPGGDPATWTTADIADAGWYEEGQHEYVDMDYPIATAMRRYLTAVLDLSSVDGIRRVPKTNIAFRRSASTSSLTMPIRDAVSEAGPFVREIIAAVDPKVIVFEGTTTAKLFAAEHATSWTARVDPPTVSTPNGRYPATIFEAADAQLIGGRSVVAICIGHPSRYGRRVEWAQVIEASRRVIEDTCR